MPDAAVPSTAPAGHVAPGLDPLDDPRIEAFGMLIETHNEVVNAVSDRVAGKQSVPVPWLSVLIRLARSPEQRLRMTQLAREMTMSTSGLTRLVDRIERAGHVRREPCPEDRRGLLAVLTPEGLEVVTDTAEPHLDVLERHLAAPLSTDELAQLTSLLRRVRDHIRSGAASPGAS